ncbi:hypothetical protein ACIGZJ_30745 [Kitasatospora sp. NPDC052868]|uniref:hypothetical protein n=1 Tax=Kitasatospora sp. NPDC052868 TaxID=3364060 RepID=UPI0037C732A0
MPVGALSPAANGDPYDFDVRPQTDNLASVANAIRDAHHPVHLTLPADQREHPVPDEDVARLSPLRHSAPAGGSLRPLRDPAEAGNGDEPDE